MNCEYCPPAELRDLLAALDTGELTWAQDVRLQQLVAADLSARRFYIEFVFLFGCLQQKEAARFSPCENQDNPKAFPLRILNNAWQQGAGVFSNTTWLSLGIAAVVIGSMLTVLSFLAAPTYEQSKHNHACNTSSNSPGRQPRDDGKLKLVARITGMHNCRWSPDGRAPYGYDHLSLGRELKLDAGLLEITYYNGAKLVLEGPVEFTVEKPNACRLDLGKLTAKVSQQAVGFTVETPTATIVDLGTEFGVTVDEFGPTDVHVFTGQVEMGAAGGRRLRLKAGQAARCASGELAVSKISLDVGRFQHSREILATVAIAPLTPDDPSIRANLKLWLKADNITEGDEPAVGSDISSWNDGSGNGCHATDAKGAAYRPTVQELPGGIRVVRFSDGNGADGNGADGHGDRLDAMNLLGGGNFGDVTIVAVYKSAATDNIGQVRSVGLGSRDADLKDDKSHINLSVEPSLRFDGHGVTIDAGYRLRHPTNLFVRTMIRGNGFCEYFNGRMVLAPTAPRDTRTKNIVSLGDIVDDFYLGELIRPINCDIAEVIVYDTALTPRQRVGIEAFLGEKYGLPTTEKQEGGPISM